MLKYFKDGDLRKQLQRQYQAITCEQKIRMIYEIAYNMMEFHDAGLIHR